MLTTASSKIGCADLTACGCQHPLGIMFRMPVTILLSLDSKTSIIYTLGEQYEIVTAYSSILFYLLSLVARFCKNFNACDRRF